ncbi:MAG: Ig-like domain-containing protein [Eubacterium sp.]|nr:Ig-like domain-containing protein [Eubacterium sp.]
MNGKIGITIMKHIIGGLCLICFVILFIIIGKDVSEPVGIRIKDGMAQEIIEYSDPLKEDYNNSNSEILRFPVYVETDYDTDLDGKPDLIKALVQLPRPAANGDYAAPVIYEASPYVSGTNWGDLNKNGKDFFDESLLHTKPEKRNVAGSATSFDAAEKAKREDWAYGFSDPEDYMGDDGIKNLKDYDDFLVRGFAVVLSAGPGTYGSEGIECSGSVMERDAFKCVAEWLHGDRIAFTDKENNIEIKADWSSGKIGMIGFSYSATMAYEVASTGVQGVETIVDNSGISSWYDYVNSQGMCTNFNMLYDYMSMLNLTCASRFFKDYDEDAKAVNEKYLYWLQKQQDDLKGDYGKFWESTDYYTRTSDMHASALLVHGLNDRNVKTKQFDLMRKAFLRSGCEVKTILHQNGHAIPWDTYENTEIMIGDHSYTDWLNLWFTHYLLGVDNEVSDMSDFMIQDNKTGEFFGTDDWESEKTISLLPDTEGEETVKAKDAAVTDSDLLENTFVGKKTENSALWKADIKDPVTINGKIPVHLRVKADYKSDIELPLSVYLIDYSETPFNAYIPYGVLESEPVTLSGDSRAPKTIVRWKTTETNRKIITAGKLDLRNPDASYEPATSVKSENFVKAGGYYDYTVFLDPTYYTLQPGHSLELYIVPFGEYEKPFLVWDMYTLEEMIEMDMDPEDYIKLSGNYSFTIDNSKSYAAIPVTKESGEFAPKEKDSGKDDKDSDGSGDDKEKDKDGTIRTAAEADEAITHMKNDSDIKGSRYAPIKLRSKGETGTSVTLRWSKLSGADKYVIYGNSCGKASKPVKIATVKGAKKKITKIAGKKIKKGTYYKFIVVALDKDDNVLSISKIVHVASKGGNVTNPKGVTVKQGKKTLSSVTLKKGKTIKIKGFVRKRSKNLKLSTHRKIKYESDNNKICSVSSSGRIKALKKGTCYIYVYAQNGLSKKIKVKVK